jgi:hypothetical protein
MWNCAGEINGPQIPDTFFMILRAEPRGVHALSGQSNRSGAAQERKGS